MRKRSGKELRAQGLWWLHDDVNESVEGEAKPLQRLVRFDPIQTHDLKQDNATRFTDGS